MKSFTPCEILLKKDVQQDYSIHLFRHRETSTSLKNRRNFMAPCTVLYIQCRLVLVHRIIYQNIICGHVILQRVLADDTTTSKTKMFILTTHDVTFHRGIQSAFSSMIEILGLSRFVI
jgi:hypothetical protein